MKTPATRLSATLRGLLGGLVILLMVVFFTCPGGSQLAMAIVPKVEIRSIYVSPWGNDHDPGTYASPVRTLARAQAMVRAANQGMTDDITVYLKSGTYRLPRPLVFTPRDSGTNGHDVVWTAVPGKTAVISGAKRISGWRLSDPSEKIWAAPVPAGLETRQIYVNGVRASLATGRSPVKLSITWNGYRTSSPVMAGWRNTKQIELEYIGRLGLMTQVLCPLRSIVGRSMVVAEPCWSNSSWRRTNFVEGDGLGIPDYVVNAYELLHKPGQFYLDSTRRVLYYIPRKGEDMDTADVEAPSLQTLITGNGGPKAPVHNITFSNLQFSYATWLQPSFNDGFSEVQANYTITGTNGYAKEGLCQYAPRGACPYGAWTKEPGNLQFRYDRNLSFANDRFIHLGAASLNLDNGSQDVSVKGCVFTDISGNGIEVGNVNMPEAAPQSQTDSIKVLDNHLYGLPTEYHGGVAILVGYAADTTISHNQIDHIAYSGISMGWGGWPDKARQPAVSNFSHDNVISDNLIYDFMETLSDGGGIYTQGVTGTSFRNGERVTGNVIHDQLAWSYALHSDDAATFVTYTNNVMYNDDYDWCCNHQYYSPRHHGNCPGVIEDNYWQQGGPGGPVGKLGLIVSGNKVIDGPDQAPASILANAGLEAGFHSILGWQPKGNDVPSPPEEPSVLYAFRERAYVTWHPSLIGGSDPRLSYTVNACLAHEPVSASRCDPAGVRPVTIAAGAFDRAGYALVTGLTDSRQYTFTVTANTPSGSSTPSVETLITTVSADAPGLPGKPTGLDIKAIRNGVRLMWYPPRSGGCTGPWLSSVCRLPPVAFVVTSSTGEKYVATGLGQIIMGSRGGRILDLVMGLAPGHRYQFSVAAVTPGGTGPAVSFPRAEAN
jgi:Right handed beta helix region